MSHPARRRLVWTFLLGAVVLAVFLPAISYDFLPLDDDLNILCNPHHGPLSWGRITWAFGDTAYVRRYLPLGWLAFSGVSSISQLAPWGYHAANIFLHAANAMLLACLLRRLLASWQPAEAAANPTWLDSAALLGAAWWALHPLRVEHVAWCSALPSNLALTFLLGALIAHASASRTGWVASIVLFGGALLSYPVTLGAVIFFPALDWARGEKRVWRRAIPFVALTLLCGFVNLQARVDASGAQAAAPTLAEFPPGLRLAQAVCVWAHYLWIPWFPFHLSPVYRDYLHLTYGNLQVLGSAALLLAAVVLAGRSPARWWLLVCYGVVVFPFTGFTESPHFPHDRYAALPGLIMAAGLGWLLVRWRSPAAFTAAGVVVLSLAALSCRQLLPWRNPVTLAQEIRRQLQPGDVPAIRDLRPAIWLYRSGDYAAAFGLLDAEIKRQGEQPALVGLRQQLAIDIANHRRLAENLGLRIEALPPLALLHQQLAGNFVRNGELEAATWHWAEVRRLAPAYYERLAAGAKQ